MSTIAERVAAGAAFLDEHDPGWWRADVERAIDLDKLDLGYGDRCILGQRCPLETLVAFIGFPPEDDDDLEFRYHAYANTLSGIPRGEREALEAWAERHGFNWLPASNDRYSELTAEWTRVISERRAAA